MQKTFRSCLSTRISLARNDGISEYFSHIFTTDEIGFKKSSPLIYEHAARVLGVSPRDCVAYDDVPIAVKAAKAAGMTTVAVEGVLFDKAECVGAADYIIVSIEDAPAFARK